VREIAFWMMSAFSARLGWMLSAASVMSSGLGYSGTSKRNTCDMRRPERSAGWASTALISSSVCRLPFISTSTSRRAAMPAASSAAAWLCSTEMISTPSRSMPASAATARMRASGPMSTGTIRP